MARMKNNLLSGRASFSLEWTATFGVNTGLLSALDIPLPSPSEQIEIVRRVDALFALADKIEGRVEAATQRVEKITQAILAKAFRGELVPTEAELALQEGRDYEPAAVLLERIRARAADEKPKTGRRGMKSKKPSPRPSPRGRGGRLPVET